MQQGRPNDNRHKILSALDELKNADVLKDYRADLRKQGRAIGDVKYTLRATHAFIREQKIANKRQRDDRQQMLNARLPLK